MTDRKVDQLIWWLMITFCSIILLGGGAWAKSVNKKIERLTTLESDVSVIKNDLTTIKELLSAYISLELKEKRETKNGF